MFEKISSKIILIQSCYYLYKKYLFISLFDFFQSLELDDKLSDQPAEPLERNHLLAVVLNTGSSIPKYSKKDLQ